MQTIVLATQKGGSGKSTLAVNLAVSAQEHGLTVRLIETDPQGTLSSWQRRRNFGSPLVESVGNATRLEQQLAIFASENVGLTIIDTPSGISTLTNAAIRHTDLCLIPVRPSMLDIEAAAPTLGTARAARTSFGFILNHATVRGRRMESAEAALADEAALELGDILARPYIGMRSDHQDALASRYRIRPGRQSGRRNPSALALGIGQAGPGGGRRSIDGYRSRVAGSGTESALGDIDRTCKPAAPLPGFLERDAFRFDRYSTGSFTSPSGEVSRTRPLRFNQSSSRSGTAKEVQSTRGVRFTESAATIILS